MLVILQNIPNEGPIGVYFLTFAAYAQERARIFSTIKCVSPSSFVILAAYAQGGTQMRGPSPYRVVTSRSVRAHNMRVRCENCRTNLFVLQFSQRTCMLGARMLRERNSTTRDRPATQAYLCCPHPFSQHTRNLHAFTQQELKHK